MLGLFFHASTQVQNSPFFPGLAGAVATFLVCVALIQTRGVHGHYTLDHPQGVQKLHGAPTPRVGGVAICLGLYLAGLMASDGVRTLLLQMLLAGMPAFVFGLADDLTKKVGVLERLAATMASALLACWLTDVRLSRVDTMGLDFLLAYPPVSVFFTVVAVAGVANAINIVDGLNGLASGVVCICLAALGLIAWNVGDPAVAWLCWTIALVVVGFLLLNYPRGKIFLGDGGAYLLGFLLAWICVMLPMRNPKVSVWAPLLVCAYPVLEVGYSMLRRVMRGRKLGLSDKLHLHSLLHTRFVRYQLGHLSPTARKAVVAPMMWVVTLVSAGLGVAFSHRTAYLVPTFALMALLYPLAYRMAVYSGRRC
jgi:UDP-N-acetylmuramyl pentapeptide phosphotransferase/UDP-N-acetylglucosamine-1-phosphate transferase